MAVIYGVKRVDRNKADIVYRAANAMLNRIVSNTNKTLGLTMIGQGRYQLTNNNQYITTNTSASYTGRHSLAKKRENKVNLSALGSLPSLLIFSYYLDIYYVITLIVLLLFTTLHVVDKVSTAV